MPHAYFESEYFDEENVEQEFASISLDTALHIVTEEQEPLAIYEMLQEYPYIVVELADLEEYDEDAIRDTSYFILFFLYPAASVEEMQENLAAYKVVAEAFYEPWAMEEDVYSEIHTLYIYDMVQGNEITWQTAFYPSFRGAPYYDAWSSDGCIQNDFFVCIQEPKFTLGAVLHSLLSSQMYTEGEFPQDLSTSLPQRPINIGDIPIEPQYFDPDNLFGGLRHRQGMLNRLL